MNSQQPKECCSGLAINKAPVPTDGADPPLHCIVATGAGTNPLWTGDQRRLVSPTTGPLLAADHNPLCQVQGTGENDRHCGRAVCASLRPTECCFVSHWHNAMHSMAAVS